MIFRTPMGSHFPTGLISCCAGGKYLKILSNSGLQFPSLIFSISVCCCASMQLITMQFKIPDNMTTASARSSSAPVHLSMVAKHAKPALQQMRQSSQGSLIFRYLVCNNHRLPETAIPKQQHISTGNQDSSQGCPHGPQGHK